MWRNSTLTLYVFKYLQQHSIFMYIQLKGTNIFFFNICRFWGLLIGHLMHKISDVVNTLLRLAHHTNQ